jgi:hypothetical protein
MEITEGDQPLAMEAMDDYGWLWMAMDGSWVVAGPGAPNLLQSGTLPDLTGPQLFVQRNLKLPPTKHDKTMWR